MSRSIWKGFYINFTFKHHKNNKNNQIYLKRNSIIPRSLNGFQVLVYNGFNFISLNIKSFMVGYKAGSFIFTKKEFKFKKNLLRKR